MGSEVRAYATTGESERSRPRTREAETVFIAGGETPVGRAIARAFLDEQWWVFAAGPPSADLDGLASAGCETVTMDRADRESVEETVDGIVERTGHIDCLVTGPGRTVVGPVEETPDATLATLLDDNLLGPHRLIRAALPHMRRAESGRIVVLSSIAGRIALPGLGGYSASMFALEALCDALRAEVGPFDVDVSVIETWMPADWTNPGPAASPDRVGSRFEPRIGESTAYRDLSSLFDDLDAIGGVPTGATMEEVAGAAIHAATCPSPETRYPVGKVARAGTVARFVPDRIRDLAIRALTRVVS